MNLSKTYVHFRNRICMVDNCSKLYKIAVEKNKLIENEKKELFDLYKLNQITSNEYKDKYKELLNKSRNMKEFIDNYNCEIEKCNDTLKNKLIIFINQLLRKINKNSYTSENLRRLKENIEKDNLTLEQRDILFNIIIKHIDELFV